MSNVGRGAHPLVGGFQPADPGGRVIIWRNQATRPLPEAQVMSELAQSLSWGRDEAELVTELQAGSDAAFEWLVTYYHAPVYNLVYGILYDAADAADVTQEVFLRVFRGIGGFRRGSSLKTWLYRISVRQALNHRRWCWRHHSHQVSIDDDTNGTAEAHELEDLDATPFEKLATREAQLAVRRALQSVPDVFRSAVILRDLEGLSYEEVAEVLEVSVGTVKSRILRGRRALRELLDPLLHGDREAHSRDAHSAHERGRVSENSPRVVPGVSPSTSAGVPPMPAFAAQRTRGSAR